MQAYTKNMQKITSAYKTKPNIMNSPMRNSTVLQSAKITQPKGSLKTLNSLPVFFKRRQSDKPIDQNELQANYD